MDKSSYSEGGVGIAVDRSNCSEGGDEHPWTRVTQGRRFVQGRGQE